LPEGLIGRYAGGFVIGNLLNHVEDNSKECEIVGDHSGAISAYLDGANYASRHGVHDLGADLKLMAARYSRRHNLVCESYYYDMAQEAYQVLGKHDVALSIRKVMAAPETPKKMAPSEGLSKKIHNFFNRFKKVQ